MKEKTVGRKYFEIFAVCFAIGTGIVGYVFIDTIIFKNEIKGIWLGLGVTIVLSGVIFSTTMLLEKAKEVIKEHNIDWKKEVVEAKIVKK